MRRQKKAAGFPRACLGYRGNGCTRMSVQGRSRCDRCFDLKAREHDAQRGKTPNANKIRRQLNKAGVGICSSCAGQFVAQALRVDHHIALRDGGTDDLTNIRVLCVGCHKDKTTAENKARAGRDDGTTFFV